MPDFCDNQHVDDFDRITWNPSQMNGQPCIRGMRLTVRRVVEAVSTYPNPEDLYRNYPDLEPEDVRQALALAAARPIVGQPLGCAGL
ncbi:MAG: DUF433 domain-containing protein [Bryobacteraceae bacterium]